MSTMAANASNSPARGKINWAVVIGICIGVILIALTLFALVVAIARPGGGIILNMALIFGVIAGCLSAFWGKEECNDGFTYTAIGSTAIVAFALLFSSTPAGIFLASLLSLLNICMLDFAALKES